MKNKFEELNWWQFDKSFTFYEDKIRYPDLTQHTNQPRYKRGTIKKDYAGQIGDDEQ